MSEKLKEFYVRPELEISLLTPEDIIITSGDNEKEDEWEGGWL